MQNDYFEDGEDILSVLHETENFNDSGIILQDDVPMEVENCEFQTQNDNDVVNQVEKIHDVIENENCIDIDAPVDDLFDACSQQFDFTSDSHKYKNVAIVDSFKGLTSKYDD